MLADQTWKDKSTTLQHSFGVIIAFESLTILIYDGILKLANNFHIISRMIVIYLSKFGYFSVEGFPSKVKGGKGK